MKTLDELKRDVFFGFMELAGRAYIQVRPSEGVSIGRRGFVGEEKERGIVLVFNPQMKFTWDEAGISASLVFGTSAEKCFIPADDIVAIYSPDIGAQFIISPGDGDEVVGGGAGEQDDNLIQVDFKKKRH